MPETFGKEDRLLKSIDFKRVLRHGKRLVFPDLTVVAFARREGRLRVGLTVSRKVGNAVVRNRVKRRLREIVRRNRERADGAWDVVVIARVTSARADYHALHGQLVEALEALGPGARSSFFGSRRRRGRKGRRREGPGGDGGRSGK